MELELAITSYQRLSPSVVSSHVVRPGVTAVIGRSDSCDWHLPDPSRVLSSTHAEVVATADGDFVIRDLSTNGVFVNHAIEPLGKGNEKSIRPGDSLRLGDYEISVSARERVAGGLEAVAPHSDHFKGSPQPLQSAPVEASMEAPAVGVLGGVAGLSQEPTTESGPVQGRARELLDVPIGAGLGERLMGDAHVDVPAPGIPDVWAWGAREAPPEQPDTQSTLSRPAATPPPVARRRSAAGDQELIGALLDGLGFDDLEDGLSPEQLRSLGSMTRILLERLLDFLHIRAQQKQDLRVKQTLFRRTENNPLKFSATSRDAVESLLLRPHGSFLGPEDAVNQAFDDLLAHERALLKGVEQVVQELLKMGPGPTVPAFGKGRVLEELRDRQRNNSDEYGDITKMLRSDVFVDAYERAVSSEGRG